MADPQQQAGGKDPLAVLEELLAKQKGQPVGGGSVVQPPAGPTPEEQEKAARLAEYERLKAEADVRDQEMLALQEAKFEALKSTPQYQARVEQQAAKEVVDTAAKDASQGYEIVQLTTTKVDVPQ